LTFEHPAMSALVPIWTEERTPSWAEPSTPT
jgi:hypothetical protein